MKNIVEDFIYELKSESSEEEAGKFYKNIPLCVDEKSKEKFSKLQEATKKKFGKKLRNLIVQIIDATDPDDFKKTSGF